MFWSSRYRDSYKGYSWLWHFVHVGLHMLLRISKDENVILRSAIEDTENNINACYLNNVKRIIITSSCISIWLLKFKLNII